MKSLIKFLVAGAGGAAIGTLPGEENLGALALIMCGLWGITSSLAIEYIYMVNKP
jgi:hypothetical protein